MVKFSDDEAMREQQLELPDPKADLSGKIVIVTGANGGLGFETAKKFAQLGASKIIIACRNVKSGEKAAKAILDSLPDKGKTEVVAWYVDFCDFKTVKAFVDKVKAELPRLDYLISNAGLFGVKQAKSKDGFDAPLQVNNIASSYMIHALLPTLKLSESPRVVLVSSSLHLKVEDFPSVDGKSPLTSLNDMGDKDKGDDRAYYNYDHTKAINVLDCQTFAELEKGVVFTSVNPGLCITDLSRDMDPAARAQFKEVQTAIGRTSEQGSRCIVWAAIENLPSGTYTSSCEVYEIFDLGLTEKGKGIAKSIWEDYQKIWKEHGLT